MTLLAPTLQAFFTELLITQRNSSPQTVASYRDTFRLLLSFAAGKTGKQPCELDIDDLDAALIGAFLNHLEHDRGNSHPDPKRAAGSDPLALPYAALRHPEHLATIGRVIAIPFKRHQHNSVCYLTSTRSRRYSPPQTPAPGSAAATTRCCCSRSRPACASPSSSRCASATSVSAPTRTAA
jgi:integrase/recombinase XerD